MYVIGIATRIYYPEHVGNPNPGQVTFHVKVPREQETIVAAVDPTRVWGVNGGGCYIPEGRPVELKGGTFDRTEMEGEERLIYLKGLVVAKEQSSAFGRIRELL